VTVPAAIGHIHCLWWWALEYAEDGDLSRFEDDEIAEATMLQGFSGLCIQALIDSGFVNADRTLHDWMEYAGRLVRARAIKATSMRARRAGTLQAQQPTAAPAPALSSLKTVKTKEIDEEYIERLVTRFGEILGGDVGIRERIDEALAHKASAKWTDKRMGVLGWLRRDAERTHQGFRNARPTPRTNPEDFTEF
jgi:hypothetical protein